MPKREETTELGLIVVRDALTVEQRKERREDNREAKRLRSLTRSRNCHARVGIRNYSSTSRPWLDENGKRKPKQVKHGRA